MGRYETVLRVVSDGHDMMDVEEKVWGLLDLSRMQDNTTISFGPTRPCQNKLFVKNAGGRGMNNATAAEPSAENLGQ